MNRPDVYEQAERLSRDIKTKAYTMYGFKINSSVVFKMFAEFGNKYIHAPPQKIVILSPYIQ